MSIKLNDKYVSTFISSHEYTHIQSQITTAAKLLREKNGAGNDFLGWLDLPVTEETEEISDTEALEILLGGAV